MAEVRFGQVWFCLIEFGLVKIGDRNVLFIFYLICEFVRGMSKHTNKHTNIYTQKDKQTDKQTNRSVYRAVAQLKIHRRIKNVLFVNQADERVV